MNIFTLSILVIRYITFAASPLDKARFKQDLAQRIKRKEFRSTLDVNSRLKAVGAASPVNLENEARCDWLVALLRPRQLIKAIKRYHLLEGNVFFWLLLLQMVVLFYLVIKCTFHMVLTGDNVELADYYEKQYYFPRLFQSYEKAEKFYRSTFVMCTYCLSVRAIAICRLAKNAIINCDSYRSFSMTQINIYYYCHMNLTPSGWLRFLRNSLNHRARCRADKNYLCEHLSVNQTLLDRVSHVQHSDLMYFVNLINFTPCYKNVETAEEECEQNESEMRKNPHLTWPLHRMDPADMTLAIMAFMLEVICMFVIFTLVSICEIYLEVYSFAQQIDTDGKLKEMSIVDTFLEFVPLYLLEPWRFIRLIDVHIYIFIQLGHQFDAGVYFGDVMVLISRAHKVLMCMRHDRKQCLAMYHTIYVCCPTMRASGSLIGSLIDDHQLLRSSRSRSLRATNRCCDQLGLIEGEDLVKSEYHQLRELELESIDNLNLRPAYEAYGGLSQSNRQQSTEGQVNHYMLNKRICDRIKMAKVLKSEFIDTKRYHTVYLNTMIIYSGFGIAYSLSLMLENSSSYSTIFCLSINLISTALPLMVAIGLSIILDNIFKNIYKTINSLIVNEGSILTSTTVKSLMVESFAFESAKDRSIQIAGQFSITPGSLGPVSSAASQ